jgi:hypothetical protein
MHIKRIAAHISVGVSLAAFDHANGALSFNFLPDPGTPQAVLDGFGIGGLDPAPQ